MIDLKCYYNDGKYCRKGLPGTLCEVIGCYARIIDKCVNPIKSMSAD